MIGVRHDYSWSETVLSFWTTLIVTVLAVTSLALRYITNPLSCFVPAQLTSSNTDYAQDVCFHSSRIFPPILWDLSGQSEYDTQHTYHQWLPFFLGVSATLCLLPHIFWRMFGDFLWIDAHQLVQTLASNQSHNTSSRHVILRDCALVMQAGLRGGKRVLGMAAMGRKVLGCVVCFLQMLMMLVVFAPELHVQRDDPGHGIAANGNDNIPLPLHSFLCNFTIRNLQNVHHYTVMCFMPLAQVYSKGLVFLFYFFLVLFLLCTVDLLLCTLRLLVPGFKDVALKRFLSMADQPGQKGQDSSPAQSSRFLDSLGLDGRLLLAVVADCCGTLAAADLINHLFQMFQQYPQPGRSPSAKGDSPGDPASGALTSTAADVSGGDVASIPMVTIGDQDGDDATKADEKGKLY